MKRQRKVIAAITAMMLAMSMMLVGCGQTAAPAASSGTESGAGSGSGSGTAAPAASTGLRLVTDGTLTVGSDCDYPPFISMDGAQPAGFEYDLMQAVGDELGLEVKYLEPQNFDTLLASVAAGTKLDVGVSSFTITDERKELVDFCTPYFDSNQAIVALKTKGYSSSADLADKVIAAQSGTTGEAWALENIPGITMKTYNQTSEALAAMMAGDVEAVIYDEPVAAEQVKTTYPDAMIVEKIATGEQYGFAVDKTNSALKNELNSALAKLKQDGRFDTIFAKYFPDLTPPSLKAA